MNWLLGGKSKPDSNGKTIQYFGAPYHNRPYPHGNAHIKVGDTVIVKKGTIAKVDYIATIVLREINWVDIGPTMELCTHVEGGYYAVINENLFKRLTPC